MKIPQINNYLDYAKQSGDSLLTTLTTLLEKKRPKKQLSLQKLAKAVHTLATLEVVSSKQFKQLENLAKPSKEKKEAEIKEFTANILFLDAIAALQVALVEYAIAYGVLLDKAVKTYIEIHKGEYADDVLDPIVVANVTEEAKAIHLPDFELPIFDKFTPKKQIQATPVKVVVAKADKQKNTLNSKFKVPKKVKDFLATIPKDNWERKAKKLHTKFPDLFPNLNIAEIKTKING